jgi:hypothetical protein
MSMKLDIDKVVNEYRSGMSIKEVSNLNGVSAFPIWKLLKANGVKFRKGPILKRFDIEIVEKYKKDKNAAKIAMEYGVSTHTVISTLKRCGVKDTSRPRIKFNHDFFENIDLPEKAYFFGWMMSDGNVFKNRVSLKITDLEIVEKFKKYLSFEGNIYSYKTKKKDIHVVLLSSNKMSSDLKKIGCVERKTFLASFPDLRKDLLPFFIRGYFEGDGCVRIRKHNNQAGVSFVGNEAVLLGIKEELEASCSVNFYVRRSAKKKYIEISCDGNRQVNRIRGFMYKDSQLGDLFLGRKLDIFKKVSCSLL